MLEIFFSSLAVTRKASALDVGDIGKHFVNEQLLGLGTNVNRVKDDERRPIQYWRSVKISTA